jgi:hypothetical protein
MAYLAASGFPSLLPLSQHTMALPTYFSLCNGFLACAPDSWPAHLIPSLRNGFLAGAIDPRLWLLASLVEPMVLLAETRPIVRVSSATSPLNISWYLALTMGTYNGQSTTSIE